jgi:hypothetical protein
VALNFDIVEITQPGSTGQQTYTLATNFNLKAIEFRTVGLATMDTNATNWSMGLGMATYRGSSVQQRYWTGFQLDAALAMDVAQRAGDEACIGLLIDAGTGGLDMEVDLVSFSSSAGSDTFNQFTLDWVGLHTTASVRVFAICYGGNDITDALVIGLAMSTSVATQNIDVSAQTGGSGWTGQPDLIVSLMPGQGAAGFLINTTQQFFVHSYGVGWDDVNVRGSAYSQDEAALDSFVLARQETTTKFLFDALKSDGTSGEDYRASLSARSAWPTNGFQLSYGVQATVGDHQFFLCLKGPFTKKLHTATAPTVAPLTLAFDHGSKPEGALAWGWNLTALTGIRSTDANLTSNAFGGYDGSTEFWMGCSDDDAAAAADVNRRQLNTKSWVCFRQDAVVASQADGSFASQAYQETYLAADASAREHYVLTLGSADTFKPKAERPLLMTLSRSH